MMTETISICAPLLTYNQTIFLFFVLITLAEENATLLYLQFFHYSPTIMH